MHSDHLHLFLFQSFNLTVQGHTVFSVYALNVTKSVKVFHDISGCRISGKQGSEWIPDTNYCLVSVTDETHVMNSHHLPEFPYGVSGTYEEPIPGTCFTKFCNTSGVVQKKTCGPLEFCLANTT